MPQWKCNFLLRELGTHKILHMPGCMAEGDAFNHDGWIWTITKLERKSNNNCTGEAKRRRQIPPGGGRPYK